MKKLEIKDRPSKKVSIRIPLDTLEQSKAVAAARELGYQSLLKLYIGEGLRKDTAEMRKHTIINEAENLLRKHLVDERKVKTILRKLKQASATV